MTKEEVEQLIKERLQEERVRIAACIRGAMPCQSYFSESECAARSEVREFAEWMAKTIEKNEE
jgi:hypothetical protein